MFKYKKISGVYKIESRIKPNRIYIGSSVDIFNRWGDHLRELRNGKHMNKKLLNHYNKYGESDLQFSIILGCGNDELLKIEQFFIDSQKPYFNISQVAGSRLGVKCSSETRLKMSKSKTGFKHPMFGKHHGDETRKIMSEKKKGVKNKLGSKLSEESKKRIGDSGRGRILSEEHKMKISEANKNKIFTDEYRKKLSDARIGIVFTEEHRKNLSLAHRGKKKLLKINPN